MRRGGTPAAIQAKILEPWSLFWTHNVSIGKLWLRRQCVDPVDPKELYATVCAILGLEPL